MTGYAPSRPGAQPTGALRLEVKTMAELSADRGTSDKRTAAPAGAGQRNPATLMVIALVAGVVATVFFELCIVSSLQVPVPRNMPFGMVGSSQVIAQAQSKVSLSIIAYPNESAAMTAIDQGSLYGAYVTGSSSDTLIVVPSKSFFAWTELEPAFLSAAHTLNRPVTVQTVKPLPPSDRVGAVTATLLLPLTVGAYLCSLLLRVLTGTAVGRWRVPILIGYAIVGAVLTNLIAGPLIGAYSGSHFWPLLPCFVLAEAAIVLTVTGIMAILGPPGMLLAFLFIVPFSGSGSGAVGVYLLPVYWRNIGVVLPLQNAGSLILNVLYFGGHNISTPLIVLFAYALAAGAVVWYVGRIRSARARATAHAHGDLVEAKPPGNPSPDHSGPDRHMRPILAALLAGLVLECLIGGNNMSAGHEPVATNLPFGVTGSSPILTSAEKNISLQVTQYPNESAVKTAIGQAKIWGALIPASAAGTPSTLIVVPSSSDLAPLDLAVRFEEAAKSTGQPLKVQQYAPVPLPPKDPFGLVPYLMLAPMLVSGFMISNLFRAVTGTAARRRRAVTLVGYAIIAGLAVDLVVCLWLQGFPSDKFWIVWPICSLIIATVALVSAVLLRLLRIPGAVLWIILLFFFGLPSTGGSNGVPYLPAFWRDIGPFLPPRNGVVLLHQTIYFGGHGTTQALAILLAYLVVFGAILVFLDRFQHSEAPASVEDAESGAALAAAAMIP